MNELINLGPAQSMFVVPTASPGYPGERNQGVRTQIENRRRKKNVTNQTSRS